MAKLDGFKVYLDIGHGGPDPGAVAPAQQAGWHHPARDEIHEAKLAHELVARIYNVLHLDHVTEGHPGPVDVTIGERAYPVKNRYVLIKRWGWVALDEGKLPVVVSVHFNAHTSAQAHGCEVLVRDTLGGEMVKVNPLAVEVLRAMVEGIGGEYPTVNRGVKQRNLVVLAPFPESSILIEPAFVSNPFEMQFWSGRYSVMTTVGWYIAQGIIRGAQALLEEQK